MVAGDDSDEGGIVAETVDLSVLFALCVVLPPVNGDGLADDEEELDTAGLNNGVELLRQIVVKAVRMPYEDEPCDAVAAAMTDPFWLRVNPGEREVWIVRLSDVELLLIGVEGTNVALTEASGNVPPVVGNAPYPVQDATVGPTLEVSGTGADPTGRTVVV